MSERQVIEAGIRDGKKKSEIAREIGVDKSTVGKEISLHRKKTAQRTYPIDCAKFPKCKSKDLCQGGGKFECAEYVPFRCSRRDRSPGACNGCASFSKCHYEKFMYKAQDAEHEYKELLSDSRIGENLTTSEAKEIADILSPLLAQGQSPYQILQNHPELKICEKTIYNYLEQGTLHEFGLGPLNLRRQVSRKISKKTSANYKKRKDHRYLIGRKYADFRMYMEEHTDSVITEMDTVYNDITNGPFIQTFSIRGTGLLLGFLHEGKTAQEMKDGVDTLENILGKALFETLVEVLLTDRGSEFTLANECEFRSDGTRRTHLFYCDPMQSGQKGRLENKHEMLRYICPKHTDLRNIGLISQNALNLALSHINSVPVKSLNGKSPLQFIAFMYPELLAKLNDFGIYSIEPDKVILKPDLLRLRK